MELFANKTAENIDAEVIALVRDNVSQADELPGDV
jgi:hypothetical protein